MFARRVFTASFALLLAASCGSNSGKSPKKSTGGLNEPCNFDGSCAPTLYCVNSTCTDEDPNENNGTNNGTTGSNNGTTSSNNGTTSTNNGTVPSFCGDGILDPGELCDTLALNNQTCETRGWLGGELTCNGECVFDESDCTNDVPFCGDGFVDPGEECDLNALNGQSCTTFGYVDGELFCNSDCTFNFDDCSTGPMCGDGVVEGGEECDGGNLNGQSCQSLGYVAGTLSCNTCTFNTSSCTLNLCGNGVAESNEVCDGNDLRGESCGSRGYTAGTLRCKSDCSGYDAALCSICGNNVVENGENCDGTNFNGLSCQQLGFTGGTLTCSDTCVSYSTANCTSEPISCNLVQSGHTCSENDSTRCLCEGCNDNGVCSDSFGELDDCICADCQGDQTCPDSECNNDGVCSPFTENCNCADCANHPECF